MSTASTSQNPSKEYIVRVPKTAKKRYHMMRFNSEHGTDFFKNWSQCRMEREGLRGRHGINEEMPKFGAGSEYGREQREEARRKRYGINIRKDKIDNQPWRLNIGGKGGKKFRGVREGGVAENAAWFVFMQGKDGSFEAYPIDEWYNFHTVKKYNSLSAEDAEKEFERRDKIMNYFQVMYEKKLRKDLVEPDDEDAPKKGGKKKKDLVLSEMDDWMSEDEEKEDDEDDGDSDDGKKKKKKKGAKRKGQGGKREKKLDGGGSDDSCIEESDDYDEGQEQDYISGDSSDSDHISEEVSRKELAGVEEDEGLKKLLASDESSEDEEEKKEGEENEDEEGKKKKEGEAGEAGEKKKKKKKKKDRRHEKPNFDKDGKAIEESKKNEDENGDAKKTVNELKRKAKENPQDMGPASKKSKIDPTSMGAGGSLPNSNLGTTDNGVTEDSIRRYLMRKPMTTTELLQKFKSKKTGLSSEQLVQSIAQILKRVNPVKQMVQGKMYLSIKTVAS